MPAKKKQTGSQERFAQEDIDKIDKNPPSVTEQIKKLNNTIEVHATDDASGVGYYCVSNSSTKPELDDSSWIKYESDTWLSASMNTGTWYCWVKDKAGNISEQFEPINITANLVSIRRYTGIF